MSVGKWCLQNMDQQITNYTVQVGLNFIRYSTVVSLVFGCLEERTDVSPYCNVHKLLVSFPGAGKQAIPVLHEIHNHLQTTVTKCTSVPWWHNWQRTNDATGNISVAPGSFLQAVRKGKWDYSWKQLVVGAIPERFCILVRDPPIRWSVFSRYPPERKLEAQVLVQ